ncbi:hypothetical protein [Streptomyces sp. CC208A]|uniref:hypothetical protein n=1 Tax=Streptomyces sp. CC208A TaxID=3044573 RepID=UPI0024A9F852|nr:hypothetical protein [Streptomyces sp. CC208A]
MTGIEIALVILASGYVAGGAYDRFKKARRERRQAQEKALSGPEPVCGCRHHLAYHDTRDGRCYAAVKDKRAKGDGEAVEPRQCPCRQYAGPEPLATLYAPELADTAGERPKPLNAAE